MATNGTTVISNPHVRLGDTALAALDELAKKAGACWDPKQNPGGWTTAPTEVAVRTVRTMNELVKAGLVERRRRVPLEPYQYKLTEAGRKLAAS